MSAAQARARARRSPRRPAPVLLVVLALLGVVLAGCSNEQPALPEATRTAGGDVGTVTTTADGVQEITLTTGDDYVFTPDTFTVEPGTVRVTVRNVAERLTHNFRFTPDTGPEPIEPAIPVLSPGEEDTIEFEVTEPGDHPFECSFHIALGQVGTMTVRAP
ncbi:plastocyanin/azurin family copper-binding protein [Modestobacter sp. SYSU DS0875]